MTNTIVYIEIMDNIDMVKMMEELGMLKNEEIKHAVLKVRREGFVPFEFSNQAYEDVALPLFEGQTISQPQTVLFMLDKLSVCKGDTVLEIGFGSGWLTALLAELVGESGHIDAFEINKILFNFGKDNLLKYNQQNMKLHNQSVLSFLENSKIKYKRIISGAAFSNNMQVIKNSLDNYGVAVVPHKDNYIYKITKNNNDFVEEKYWGYVFVPLK